MSALGERMPRLLALVPYLLAHPGVRLQEAAAELDVSVAQLRRDLQLLWMCGLPGYGPGELVDLSFEGDTVSVIHDAGMRRPLRLSRAEASALAVALRSLGEVGGLVSRDVVERALAKVEAAAGGGGGREAVTVVDPEDADPVLASTTALLSGAVAGSSVVRLRYYSASRDAVTERDVEPHRLLVVDGRSYLEAWCRRAEAVRLFRVDRVEQVQVLDEQVSTVLPPVSDGDDPFDLSDDLPLAVLDLDPRHGWVAEYYPVEQLSTEPDGTLRVALRYTDTEWLLRLVLGLGGGVRVREPAGLAEEARSRAADALAAYARHPLFTPPSQPRAIRRGFGA